MFHISHVKGNSIGFFTSLSFVLCQMSNQFDMQVKAFDFEFSFFKIVIAFLILKFEGQCLIARILFEMSLNMEQ